MCNTCHLTAVVVAASGGAGALAQIDFSFTTVGTTTVFSETDSSYFGTITTQSPDLGFLTMSSSSVFDPVAGIATGPAEWAAATGTVTTACVCFRDLLSLQGFYIGNGTWDVTGGTGAFEGYTGSGTYHSFIDFSTGATQMDFVGVLVPVPAPAAAPLLVAGGLVLTRRRRAA